MDRFVDWMQEHLGWFGVLLVWLVMGIVACVGVAVVGYAVYGISILIEMATGSRMIAVLSIIPLGLVAFFGIGYLFDNIKRK